MTRRSMLAIATLVVLGATVSTCKDATDPSRPGFLEVRLASPNVDDGGLYFTIGGAKIDSVTTQLPVIAAHAVTDSLWHVVVGGSVTTGPVARIWVPDTRAVSRYSGSVLQVVVRTSNAQRSAAGYAVVAATP